MIYTFAGVLLFKDPHGANAFKDLGVFFWVAGWF